MPFFCQHFDELNTKELYEILRSRQEVFVVEQNCPYLDADGKDATSWHLSYRSESGALLAYCRILPPFLAYPEYSDVSIGRVISTPETRRTGAGRLLMQEAILQIKALFLSEKTPEIRVRIGAQSYLLGFYGSFGFQATPKTYLEDGIWHTEMLLHLKTD